jgi:hypothetical protein
MSPTARRTTGTPRGHFRGRVRLLTGNWRSPAGAAVAGGRLDRRRGRRALGLSARRRRLERDALSAARRSVKVLGLLDQALRCPAIRGGAAHRHHAAARSRLVEDVERDLTGTVDEVEQLPSALGDGQCVVSALHRGRSGPLNALAPSSIVVVCDQWRSWNRSVKAACAISTVTHPSLRWMPVTLAR